MRLFAPLRLFLPVLLLCTLLLPLACASPGPVSLNPSDAASLVTQADQLAGVYLTWQESARAPEDTQAALVASLAIVGVDLDSVQAVTPSLSGLLVAERVVQAHPALAEHSGLIARLWTLALHRVVDPRPSSPAAGGPMTSGPPGWFGRALAGSQPTRGGARCRTT